MNTAAVSRIAAASSPRRLPSAYLMTTPPNCLAQGRGLLVPYSAAIRKAVKVPVFTAIGIRDPEEIENILENGSADMIVLGRPQLADPDYVRKVAESHPEQIRHCMSCEFCLDTLDDDRRICCAVNPETGREHEFHGIPRAETKKKVVVIGGGASGAETADYFSGLSVELSVIGAEKLGGELKFRSTEIAPKNDRDISILEMLPEICAEQDVFCKEVVLTTLRANGVHMHPGCRVEGIESDGVRAYDMAAKQEIFLPADTVILAGGLRSNAEDAFQDTAYPVIRVGDAIRADKIHAAIYTAYCAARSL